MIEINNLSKVYNKDNIVLHDINLSIKDGEIIALLGSNGSGKSTIIKCLVGVLKSTTGNVMIDGLDTFKQRKKIIPQIGVLFNQKPSFIVDLNIMDNLMFFKTIYNINEEQFKSSLEFIDQYLDIHDLYQKAYRKLSFGERVKCEIASILLHNPKYIILDEPTIGLDYNAKQGLYELCRKYNQKNNSTIFVVTHEIEYIQEICTRVVLLDKGSVIYDGKPSKLGKYFKKYVEIQVSYYRIVDTTLANNILNNATDWNQEKCMFSYTMSIDDDRHTFIKNVNEAFEISSIITKNDDLRGIFKDVLKQIKTTN